MFSVVNRLCYWVFCRDFRLSFFKNYFDFRRIMALTRMSAPTATQKNLLKEFLREHPQLLKGSFSATFTHQKAQDLWQEVSEKLNAIPGGASKDWKKWRKTWQDLKKKTKGKMVLKKKEFGKTGGGPQSDIQIDNNVAELIDIKEVEGHIGVKEPQIIFCLDKNQTRQDPQMQEVQIHHPQTVLPQTSFFPQSSTSVLPKTSTALPQTSANDFAIEDLIIDIGNEAEDDIEVKVVEEKEKSSEHNYGMKYRGGVPKKKMNQTQRLTTSIKLSQELVKGVEYRNNILENYYLEKTAFVKHKIGNDAKLLQVVQNLTHSVGKNTEQAKALLQIIIAEYGKRQAS